MAYTQNEFYSSVLLLMIQSVGLSISTWEGSSTTWEVWRV